MYNVQIDVQIEITSSRGTLVYSVVISKDTMNWESTRGRRWRIMEEKVNESSIQNPE